MLRIGTSTRPFRFEFISNSPIVDAEFDRWRADHEARRLRTPTAQSLRLPAQNVARSREHELSPDEVAQIIKAKAVCFPFCTFYFVLLTHAGRGEAQELLGGQG